MRFSKYWIRHDNGNIWESSYEAQGEKAVVSVESLIDHWGKY